MKLEAICRVAMGDHGLEVCGQVDNTDGIERAFLWADTAANAQSLRNEGNLGLGSDFDAQLAGTHNWTRLFAFLTTFLWR